VSPETKLGGADEGDQNIMHTRKLILIAKGPHKADIIRQALTGACDDGYTASVVQLHPNCEILLDAEAASGL